MLRAILPFALLLLALPAGADAAKPKKQFLVSVGDSYATGYQPKADGSPGGSSGKGFADQMPALARKRGYRLQLRNFGCGGATTTSLLERRGCPKRARGAVNPVAYKSTQATAAAKFLRKHRKRTALVTVSISGNDVTKCAGEADAITCVADAVDGINTNLKTLLARLRAAAGKKVRIVGITYPDVILGGWVSGRESDRQLARLSQVAFEKLINPALREQYEAVGGTFVDVTQATQGYESLDGETTTTPGFGEYSLVPVPVARICELTWYCAVRDIHARDAGYRLIAKLIAARLPKRG